MGSGSARGCGKSGATGFPVGSPVRPAVRMECGRGEYARIGWMDTFVGRWCNYGGANSPPADETGRDGTAGCSDIAM